MTLQEIPRESAAPWPQRTTAAALGSTLHCLQEQFAAIAGLASTEAPRAELETRLRRAHVQIARAEFESRAIYAVADRSRTPIPHLTEADVFAAVEAAGLLIVSDVPAPKLEPLQGAVEATCPRCNGLLMTWTATGATPGVPGSYYTDDGDIIPGAPLNFAGCQSAIGVMVGRCPRCEARHWSLEVILHDGGDDAVLELMYEEPDWDQFTAGRNWLAYTANTEDGRGYQHVIGPLLVPEGMETHGSNGVSACGGGAFWRHALAVFESYRPRLEAVQRQLVQVASGTEGAPA